MAWVSDIIEAIAASVQEGVEGAARRPPLRPDRLVAAGALKSVARLYSVECAGTELTQTRHRTARVATSTFTIRLAIRLKADDQIGSIADVLAIEAFLIDRIEATPTTTQIGSIAVQRVDRAVLPPDGIWHVSTYTAACIHMYTPES
jgi:hypothetical protein